jgi:fatty-acyl-CoA synthase
MIVEKFQSWILRRSLARFQTARDLVRFAFRFYGKRIAVVERRGAFTYRDMAQRSLQLSAAMEDSGIKKGDLVFTWLPETGEQLELRLATLENGAILAMFHQGQTPDAALQALRRLKPKMFFHDNGMSGSIIDAVKTEFPQVQCIALGVEYENFLADVAARRSQTAIRPQDYSALQFTSGSTGQPKAIAVTHEKQLLQLRMWAQELSLGGGANTAKTHDVVLLGFPLTGLCGGMLLSALLSGSTVVLPTDYTVPVLTSLIRRWRVTSVLLSPLTLIDLLDDPQRDLYDLSSLRHVIYGADMMPAAKLDEALRWLGPIFQQGYGSVEAMPPLTWLSANEHVDGSGAPASKEVLGSAGRVAADVGIRVVNEAKRKLHDGHIGQIVVKTPLAFTGYWGYPELNDAAFYRGWVITGDMGYVDAHERLHVLGRRVDTVHRGAQAIYPRQVEDVAHGQAAVRDACLVQINDEAHLAVTLRHAWRKTADRDALTREIESYLHQHLASELRPDRVHIIDVMPRSFLNQTLRSELREQLLQQTWETTQFAPLLVSNPQEQEIALETV